MWKYYFQKNNLCNFHKSCYYATQNTCSAHPGLNLYGWCGQEQYDPAILLQSYLHGIVAGLLGVTKWPVECARPELRCWDAGGLEERATASPNPGPCSTPRRLCNTWVGWGLKKGGFVVGRKVMDVEPRGAAGNTKRLYFTRIAVICVFFETRL